MKNKLFVFILAFLVAASAAFAQTVTVTGRVTDAQTGEPVSFVTVIQQGTSNAVSADVDGHYSINVPSDATLRFSIVGYEEMTVAVAGRRVVDVAMQMDANILQEAVVSALGITRAARSLTYAAQSISSEEIASNRAGNMITSLAGKASGVTVTQSSAGMGGSAKISIRGFRSVSGGNEPLYIINGVPMANDPTVSGDTYGSGGSYSYDRGDGIGNINPDDIESISILKGASASALYGTEAANGVILITTKKGKAGTFSVSVNSSTSFDKVAYGHKLQKDYGHLDNWYSWGSKISNGTSAYDTFFTTAPSFNNSISIQGGSERNQTYLSYGNSWQGTVLDNDGHLNRHNLTLRNTTYFRPNLSLDASIQMIRQYVKNRPATGGLYNNPLLGIYHFPADMDIAPYKKEFEIYDMDRNIMKQNWIKVPNSNIDQNPYWILNRMPYETWRHRAIGSLTLRWDITPKVYVQARGSADFTADRYEHKVYATTPPDQINSANGMYKFGQSNDLTAYGDFLAGYKDKWGDFALNATIGTSIRYGESYGVSHDSRAGGGELYFANIFTMHNMTARAGSQSWYRSELIGVFGTATLSFKDWLFLDVTGRNDWSSTLAYSTSFKTGFFYPSVGISAILNEAFNMPSWIDLFKVRASYAVVGNDLPSRITNPLGSVSEQGTISSNTTAPFGELKPELSASLEAGFDLRLFNSRLTLDFEYYKTNTRNQLFSLEAPAGSGYTSYYVNSGNIQNQGIEATLGIVPVENRNFVWRSNFNIGLNRNKVISLNDDITTYSINSASNHGYEMRLVEGGSYGDIYGRTLARDANGKLLLDDEGLPYQGSATWEYLGNTEAKLTVGWNNNIQIGNFNLGFLIDARLGGIFIDMTQADIDGYGSALVTATDRNRGYAEYEGIKFNNVQKFYERVGTYYGITEYYTYDGTNIRLREASLGFSLPKKWLGNNGFVKDCSISAIGRNLCFFYKKTAVDPDALLDIDGGYQGFSFYNMPATRSIGFNVKITF